MVSARIAYAQANTHEHINIAVHICRKMSIFWEVIVSVILSKKFICTCDLIQMYFHAYYTAIFDNSNVDTNVFTLFILLILL
jgi:hypothetical protein